MNDRRENTNQHGAKVPTEAKAIRHIEAEDMRQARKLYGLIVRSCNFGGADSPDVIGLPGVHIEVKRVERLNLTEAYAQAFRDAAPGEIPAVFHRKNREPWMVTVSLEDFLKLYEGGSHGLYHG